MKPRVEQKILKPRETPVETTFIRGHQTHYLSNLISRRSRIKPEHSYATLCRSDKAGNSLHESGLPLPVPPHKSKDFACMDGHRDLPQRDNLVLTGALENPPQPRQGTLEGFGKARYLYRISSQDLANLTFPPSAKAP